MKLSNLFRVAGLVAVFTAGAVNAQLGADNPTGPSGVFNGNTTTGCSYDPYTGNATRSIREVGVGGSISRYGLSFVRTTNSRGTAPSPRPPFGRAGAWKHNFSWQMQDSEQFPGLAAGQPSSYYISFPDGRAGGFSASASDVYFRDSGFAERLQPLNLTTKLAYLILSDGGKVEFQAKHQRYYDPDYPTEKYAWWTYQAKAIIDPYGQRTELSYNTNLAGDPNDDQLNTITDVSSGRWIQLVYATVPGSTDSVIDHINSSDGQAVKYQYTRQSFAPGTAIYTVLSSVVYRDKAALTATYTYQAPNTGGYNGSPLLSSCVDPMFAGPMWKIAYTYAPNVTGNVYGQIKSESHPNGTLVSSLAVSGSTRTETRGDGPSRTFTYSGNLLQKQTDFSGKSSSQTYDANLFVNSTTDANSKRTDYTRNPLNGNVTLVTYPLTGSDTALGNLRAKVQIAYGGASCADPNNRDGNMPYYPCSVTDERGYASVYTRDANKRVTNIAYPDGGSETFAYNSRGQVISHRAKTGGLETYTYDGGGTLTEYRGPYQLATADPAHPNVPASVKPTLKYGYDALHHVQTVTDALDRVTSYSYNDRGQVLVTTFPGASQPHVTNVYNDTSGTLKSVTDELGHITSYQYDDYRRLTSVTTPIREAGETTPRTSTFDYTRWGTANSYLHTAAFVFLKTSPGGKKVRVECDNDFRRTLVLEAPDSIAAKTVFEYDDVGNLTKITDPRNYSTT